MRSRNAPGCLPVQCIRAPMDQPAMRQVSRFTELHVITNTCRGAVLATSLLLSAVVSIAGNAGAQAHVAKTPAAILTAPNGRAFGRVREGAPLRVLETRGAIARVSVDGFVERARLSGQRGSESPRVGSRNAVLRSKGASAARSVASLDAGTSVSVARGSAPAGWVRVSRTGWVLRSSLTAPTNAGSRRDAATNRSVAATARPRPEPKSSAGEVAATTASRSASPAAIVAGSSTTAPVPALAARDETSPSPPPTTEPAVSAGRAAAGLSLADSNLVPTANVPLRAAPDARALATVSQGTTLIPLARERGWVRVRLEGWVPERDVAPADSTVKTGISAADLRADPQGSRGKVVRWTVQVLARQSDDALRRDLAANYTYLLARGPDDENALLYLVIPPSMLESSKSLPTLSTATITARVRTGKSELVGVPILDLLTITSQK